MESKSAVYYERYCKCRGMLHDWYIYQVTEREREKIKYAQIRLYLSLYIESQPRALVGGIGCIPAADWSNRKVYSTGISYIWSEVWMRETIKHSIPADIILTINLYNKRYICSIVIIFKQRIILLYRVYLSYSSNE